MNDLTHYTKISIHSLMNSVLQHRAEVYGLLALWIMLFHLNMFLGPLLGLIWLGRLASLGDCCVDVFLFLSGYCIFFSWNKDPNYKRYFLKRVQRVIIPYLIIAAPYYIWKSYIGRIQSQSLVITFLKDLSGLSFFNGNLDSWFPLSIMFFYIITPGIILIIKKGKIPVIILLYVALILLLNNVHFFEITGIMWSRLPAYLLGVFCAMNRDAHFDSDDESHLPQKGVLPFVISCAIILLFIITPLKQNISDSIGIDQMRLFYVVLILPILYISNFVVKVVPTLVSTFLSFCGNISLEIYLIHLLLIYVIAHYGLNVWFYPLALILTIPIAYCTHLLSVHFSTRTRDK